MDGFLVIGVIVVIAVVIIIMKKRRENMQRLGGYNSNSSGLLARAKSGLSHLGNCCKKTIFGGRA